MDTKKYWKEKHKKYLKEDWITNPTVFAKFAVKYFPNKGKLLELGAGQGQDSRYFYKKGYEVLGTDFSDEALNIARQKAKEEKLDMNFKQVDLQKSLPFQKHQFDVVYSHLAIHYFDIKRTEDLFNEIYQITKPYGILALLLNTIDDPEVSNSKKVEEGLYETPSGLIKRFYTVDDIQNLTKNKFKTLVLDNEGVTYKDKIKTLIRYVGQKL